MANNIIQKRSALYLKIPFVYGRVCSNDIYKGYDIEIKDIDSSGFYLCSVPSVDPRMRKNYRPYDILPAKDEETVEKIRKELDIILDNEGYFSTLNENDKPIVENIRRIFKHQRDRVIELYRYFYQPINLAEKEIAKQFLILIFDKIKKQFDLLAVIGLGEDIEFNNELDDIIDEVMSFDQIQHTSFEIEFLQTDFTSQLKNAFILLNMSSDPIFINFHLQRLENIINSLELKNIPNYEPIITAYIFIHLNETGYQINYNDLIGIKHNEIIRPSNDNPEYIINILYKLKFLNEKGKDIEYYKGKVEYYIHKIITYLGIEIVPSVKRIRDISHIKRKPIPKTINKKLLLLPDPIKLYIKEPITWYIKDKIENKINNSVSPQIYKNLLSYFDGNSQALKGCKKTSDEYKLYIQPFIKEYTDRIDQTELLVKEKLKVHSNLIKNLKSPDKNHIKQAMKEIIKDKINSANIQEKENKILQLLLTNFDNIDKIYSLIGNPEYYDVIKKYLVEYESLLNNAIQLNNKIGELAFREKIDRELVIRSNMNNVVKEIKNEYRKKLHDNEILYKDDLIMMQKLEFQNFKNDKDEKRIQNKLIKELREKYKSDINKNINTKVKTEVLKNLNIISGYTDNETNLIKYQLMLNKEFKSYANEPFDYEKYIQTFIKEFVSKRFHNKLNLNLNLLRNSSKQDINIKQKSINTNKTNIDKIFEKLDILGNEFRKVTINEMIKERDTIKNTLNKNEISQDIKVLTKAINEIEILIYKQHKLETIIKERKMYENDKKILVKLVHDLDILIYEEFELMVIKELQKKFTNFNRYDADLIKFINQKIPKEYKNKLELDVIKCYTDNEIKYKNEVLKIKESFNIKENEIKETLGKSKSIETIKQEKGILIGSMNYKLYSAILLSLNAIAGYSLKDTNLIKYQLLIHEQYQKKKDTDLNKFIEKNIPKDYHKTLKYNIISIKKYTKFDISYKREILKIKGLFMGKEKSLRKELDKTKSKSKSKSKKVNMFNHFLDIKKSQVETDLVNCIKNSKDYTSKEKEFLLKNIYKIKDITAIKQLKLNSIEDTNESKLIQHLIKYHSLYKIKIIEIAKMIRAKI